MPDAVTADQAGEPALAEEVDPPDASDAADAASRRLRVLRSPAVALASAFLLLVVFAAVFAPLLAPHDPYAQAVGNRLARPSRDHLLGTDDLGRDVLSRLIYGGRISMRVSFVVVGVALAVAVPAGLLIGYVGGRVDSVLMRLVDAFRSFPPIVLALAIAGVMGPGVNNVILALVIVVTPGLIRLVRGQALAIREETFVEASRSIGTTTRRILRLRVLHNVASPVIVQVAYLLGTVLIAEASLSYLGLGAQAPAASWGNMLRAAYDTALFTEPWLLVIPGAAIALTVFAFNELSDGLRDTISAASRGRSHRDRPRGRGITVVEARRDEPLDREAARSSHELLRIEGLSVEFTTHDGGSVRVVEDVSLGVGRGEVLGLVGESGSGKTVTSMSILRLLQSPPARIVRGSVWFEGQDLLELPFRELRRIRGDQIGVVFQDATSSLDPAQTIGAHLVMAQRFHRDVDRATARRRAVEMLDLVGIPGAAQRLKDYPHQLSGGMRQRVMIALALVNDPKLLIADEPTTALDVTIQAQILDLLRRLRQDLDLSVLFVTHDLGVVADLCDRVAVMYAGQVVELAAATAIFERPRHPYTSGLLRAMPQVGASTARLNTIPGVVPAMTALPVGCRFHPRCPHATPACRAAPVHLTSAAGAQVRCVRADDLALDGST